jgi:hypothetical protein
MTPFENDFRAFFENYARMFHEDVERFCDLYEFPCTTARLDGTVHRFPTKKDAVGFFTTAKQTYEAEGCRRWAMRELVADQPPSGGAVVTVDWDMLDDGDSPIRGWRQSYTLVRSLDAWKVRASVLLGGSERKYREPLNLPLPSDGASRRR